MEAWSHDLHGIKMASGNEDVVLDAELYYLPKKKGLHKVILTRRGLYFHAISNNSTTYAEVSIQISDIIGCHILDQSTDGGISPTGSPNLTQNSSASSDDDKTPSPSSPLPKVAESTSGFVMFAYPFRKKRFSGKRVRHRHVIAFEIPTTLKESLEERVKLAELWCNIINCLSRDLPINVSDLPSCVPPPRGKLLLLINPHSGPGKANIIFKTEVAPMLHEAGFPYKAIITEYAGHASELLKTMNLSQWYGVVIISGDGLIFETINGIMQRDDWATSIRMPIGCLPGGSGNALCCAITYAAGEPIDASIVLHSTFVLVKHKVVPTDLVAIHIPDRSIFSFLSVTWGIMADIDYESEKYRNLGEARFTVGAIKRILKLRTYKGCISFLPVAEYRSKESVNSSKVLTKIRRFSLRSHSSSRCTLDSEGSSRSNSPRLLARRSYSMGASGYSEVQLRHAEGKTVVNGELENGAERLVSESSIDEENNTLDDYKPSVTFGLDQTETNNLEENNGDPFDGVNSNVVANGDISATSRHDRGNVSNTCASNISETIPTAAMDVAAANDLSSTDLVKDNAEILPGNSGACRTERSRKMTILSDSQEVGVEQETYHGLTVDNAPVPTPLLPPLDQEVPDNWVRLDGEFVLMTAVYQTHLGSDMLAAPDAHLCDGHIHLMMVRGGISKNALLNLFLSFGQGGHVYSPYVDYVKVLAFRLEPDLTRGNIMVDGERFAPTAVQGQILPGLARVMAIK